MNHVPVRNPWIRRAWLAFVAALLLILTGALIGPRVPTDQQVKQCVGNVDLPGPFGFGLNCDGPVFMALAREPAGLLRKGNTRQSRPGIILLAAVLEKPLALVLADRDRPVDRFQPDWTDNAQHIAEAFQVDLPAFLAYLLLNVGVLLLVFGCLGRILLPERRATGPEAGLWLATGVLLCTNDVTKAFLLAPHTQLLNILAPVLAVEAARRTWLGALERTRFAIGLGLAVGVGMLTYAVFAVVVAAVGVAWLARVYHWRTMATSLRNAAPVPESIAPAFARPTAEIKRVYLLPIHAHSFANLALLTLLAALPSFAWIQFVKAKTGEFFSQELAMGQIVWMRDAWHEGAAVLAHKWWEHLRDLLKLAAPQAVPVLALLVLAGVVAALRWRTVRSALRQALPLLTTCVLVAWLAASFYTCVGLINERLAFTVVPALLVLGGALLVTLAKALPLREQRWLARAGIAIAVAQALYSWTKDGPWS